MEDIVFRDSEALAYLGMDCYQFREVTFRVVDRGIDLELIAVDFKGKVDSLLGLHLGEDGTHHRQDLGTTGPSAVCIEGGSTDLTQFADSGESQGASFLLPEQVDDGIRVQLRLVPGNGLGDQHLDHSDHAPPAHVLTL